MSRKLLRNCLLLDPEAAEPRPGSLLLEDDRIADVLEPEDPAPEESERVDLKGAALAPGFIDLHFHGSSIFCEPAACARALRHDSASQARHGTTAFLATTVARPARELAEVVGSLAEACGGAAEWPGAVPLGIHLEGPWIHGAAAGAQPTDGIRSFERAEADELLARAAGWLRMVTLAPEVEGSAGLLELLMTRDIIASLGHSHCTAEQAEAAILQGARHVTHLFNAMGPLHHRAPGLAGVALADARLSADVIADGVHVDSRMLAVAARAKGEGLVLITDRIDPPSGADFGAGPVEHDGRAWRLPDGRLAGSRLGLDRAIAHATASGFMTRLEAVAACTLRPARLLGVEAERGTLRQGALADLVVLDDAGAVLETWVAGNRLAR